MKVLKLLILSICLVLFAGSETFAHFGMVISSQTNVMESKDSAIRISLKFWHPFENKGLDLEKPAVFQVIVNGTAASLLPTLIEKKEQGVSTWQSEYSIKRPGLYLFVMEPLPYFEKDEDCFIVHITKTYVSAFGGGEDWGKPVGLEAEIVPLTDPNALYAGNLFQGRVLQNGEIVSGATVEVEWYPGEKLAGEAPYENMITQTVKADDFGIFSYVAPRNGWWGFAALLEGDKKIEHEGKPKDVELGAVLWTYFHPLLPAQELTDK